MMKLYTRTESGAIGTWEVWTSGDKIHTRWGIEGGAMQTSSKKAVAKNIRRANATTAEEQAVVEAAALAEKQLKKKGYFRSSEEATNTHVIAPMLAQSFADRVNKKNGVVYPVTVQRKYDGFRCLAYAQDGEVVLQSRGNDRFDVSHIASAIKGSTLWRHLLDGYVLDGEIYVHGATLQRITSWVRRPQDASLQLRYFVYDLAVLPGSEHNIQPMAWPARMEKLGKILTTALESRMRTMAEFPICPVPCWTVNTVERLQELHDEFVKDGYEGAIVRLHTEKSVYRMGARPPELLKYKNFDDNEFEIVGYTVGRGKSSNTPIFACKTKDGHVFEVMPRGTEADRAALLAEAPTLVGHMMTVRHFGFTDGGKPRNPIGHAIRYPGT